MYDIIAGMKDYEKFMYQYWNKYPDEEQIDYSIDEISELIDSGLLYHLAEFMFVIYKELSDVIEVQFYCIDMGNYDQRTVRKVFIGHKKFVTMFDKPVVISDLKEFYQRKSIAVYSNKQKHWRFV